MLTNRALLKTMRDTKKASGAFARPTTRVKRRSRWQDQLCTVHQIRQLGKRSWHFSVKFPASLKCSGFACPLQSRFIPAGKHHAGGGDAGIWENDAFSLSNFTAHKNENANPPKRLVPLRALGSTANTGMGRAGRSNLVTMNLLFKWLFLTAIGTRVWS